MAGSRITRVATAGIPVTDQDRALEFYVGVLGFEKVLDGPFGDGARWIEVAPPGATTTVALIATKEPQTRSIDAALRYATEDADADHARLKELGSDVDEEMMRWEGVPPMFTLRDPDGNILVLVERE
ncbi:MAG TPA: VOC family protein [Acidimicrobiia bacterium]|jgi:predicted enzyme related to lactoylglutathione lyase|nr:VOC family protein [Acidimicrobiia bacterium]